MQLIHSFHKGMPLSALSESGFASLIVSLGPFEERPHLALGVSGGSDSLALCLLADRWARSVGGMVSALSVDHGLRKESAIETRQVAAWLGKRGITCHILSWIGEKPATGIQEAARIARYSLLRDWCRRHGVLHLLLAHHQDDQAETFLLRIKGKSGLAGLAAMASLTEEPDLRILRPVLGIPKRALQSVLEAEHHPWIDDPSNADGRYGRVAIRSALPDLARAGIDSGRLARTAAHLGQLRMDTEQADALLASGAVSIHPAGFARCRVTELLSSKKSAVRILRRVLGCIGGRKAYGPNDEQVRHVLETLIQKRSGMFSLAGCLLIPADRHDSVWICREIRRNAPSSVFFNGAAAVRWDGRFIVKLEGNVPPTWCVRALGEEGLGHLPFKEEWELSSSDVFPGCLDAGKGKAWPRAVRRSLPALYDHSGLVAIPHLGYDDRIRRKNAGVVSIRTSFLPGMTVTENNDFLAYK